MPSVWQVYNQLMPHETTSRKTKSINSNRGRKTRFPLNLPDDTSEKSSSSHFHRSARQLSDDGLDCGWLQSELTVFLRWLFWLSRHPSGVCFIGWGLVKATGIKQQVCLKLFKIHVHNHHTISNLFLHFY